MSSITLSRPLVSVDWLHKNLEVDNLIILDTTIKKVTGTSETDNLQEGIPNTRFFDLKYKFSNVNASFPNTVPSETQFTKAAQELGIHKNNAIIVYDTKGIYSSPRAWWLFKTMGYNNVAVLDGGLPEWIAQNYPTETVQEYIGEKGNFIAKYNSKMMRFFEDIKIASNDDFQCVIDARSSSRFKGEAKEPRAGLRSGNIPSSVNLPYTELFNRNVLKPIPELKRKLNQFAKTSDTIIFSCGSGITACILALGADLCNYQNISVYDGSWTEWGSLIK